MRFLFKFDVFFFFCFHSTQCHRMKILFSDKLLGSKISRCTILYIGEAFYSNASLIAVQQSRAEMK